MDGSIGGGAFIEAWAPRGFSPETAGFARSVVTALGPLRPERAKALLFAAAKLASFASSIGLELDAQVLLRDSVIERFVASPYAGSPPTRRTLRTNLRFLARHVVPYPAPAPVSLSRERAKAPHTTAEIAAYLALGDTQPTQRRRARANALICLGAGAGLSGGELRHVRGVDVCARSGGVLIEVRHRRPRAVPVLVEYHERLLDAAGFFADAYLVSGRDPNSHNVTNPLISSLSGGSDLGRLETGRLRSSYLVALAQTIGLRAFMDAAGISCSQRLGDLVAHLRPEEEASTVALLCPSRRA